MGTVIMHGKSAWGRGNKHKRQDKDLEFELQHIEKTNTTKEFEHVDIIRQVAENVAAGETLITKVEEISNLMSSNIEAKDEKINKSNVPVVHKCNQPKKNESVVVSEQSKIDAVKLEQQKINDTKTSIKQKDQKLENKIKRTKKPNKKPIHFIEDIENLEEKLNLLNS